MSQSREEPDIFEDLNEASGENKPEGRLERSRDSTDTQRRGALCWVEMRPPKIHTHMGPQNATLFGKVFVDIIKLIKVRSHGI